MSEPLRKIKRRDGSDWARDGSNWTVVRMQDLKKNDFFQMFESDGEGVQEDGTLYKASTDPYPTDGVWGIVCDTIPAPPKPPLNRLLRESDGGPFCKECGSSLQSKFIFWKTDRCINTRCDNYHK